MSKYGVFSGPYFPVFGLNAEIYGVNLRIQSEYRKIWTRNNSVFGHFSHRVTLGENGKLVRDQKKEVTNIFNDLFLNIVPNLVINTEHDFLNTVNISNNPIENAIYIYENHPSAIAIKKHVKGTDSSFPFQAVSKENTAKLTTNLDNKKAVQSADIPTKLVTVFGCLFSSLIASNVNKCINEGAYVDASKKAEVRPLYKKDGITEKSNYRLIN